MSHLKGNLDNDDLLERFVQPLGSLEENPGLYQVKDGAEETGRSVSASASRRDQKIIAERRNRERRIKTLLVNANSNFVQTLADSKGLNSQCHARFGDQISTEKHCNNINVLKVVQQIIVVCGYLMKVHPNVFQEVQQGQFI